MSLRSIGLLAAIGSACVLFGSGCEKKAQGPGSTMTQTLPTGPGKDTKPADSKPKESKPTAQLEQGSGDLGNADFGQKKRLSF